MCADVAVKEVTDLRLLPKFGIRVLLEHYCLSLCQKYTLDASHGWL